MAIQGQSRSRVLGSMESRRGTPYSYIIKLAEDTTSENTENNSRCRHPHCYLTFPDQGPREYPHKVNIIFPETTVTALNLRRWQYWSIFIQIFVVGSKTHVFWNRMRNGRSRSSKVVDFDTNRKRICNLIVTLVLPCSVSEMGLLQVFCWKQRPNPIPPEFCCVPLGLNHLFLGSGERRP